MSKSCYSDVSRRNFLTLLAGSASLALAGCDLLEDRPAIVPTPKPLELPVAGIPRSMREWNWGGGSCVYASWVMTERRLNLPDLAAYIRKTYSGGESYSGLVAKMRKLGVPFYSAGGGGGQDIASQHHKTIYMVDWMERQFRAKWFGTASGDVDVLERSTAERRMSVIFYYPNHSIAFCGFGPSALGASGEQAHVLDNNRIESYIEIPKQQFITNWRRYGGVSVCPTHAEPPPPTPYIAA